MRMNRICRVCSGCEPNAGCSDLGGMLLLVEGTRAMVMEAERANLRRKQMLIFVIIMHFIRRG